VASRRAVRALAAGRVALVGLLALVALVIPPPWIFAGYALAAVPGVVQLVRGRPFDRRLALAAALPPAYALLKGGYLPPWTAVALAGGFLPALLRPRAARAAGAALWAAGVVACAVEFHTMAPATVPARSEIVFVGDSLSLMGVEAELRALVPVPVAGAAVSGISAREALATVIPKIEGLRDRCFVVELGGHDHFRGASRDEIEPILDEILTRLARNGNSLVVVEIPNGVVRDRWAGVYRRLARKHGAALVPDTLVRSFVLVPWLNIGDRLHPNAAGSRMYARAVARRVGVPRPCQARPSGRGPPARPSLLRPPAGGEAEELRKEPLPGNEEATRCGEVRSIVTVPAIRERRTACA